MLKVKLNNQFPKWDWLRQTPNHSGIWKDMQFYVNTDEIVDCDFFVVMGGLLKDEKINCPKENTIFIALENEDIQVYDQSFLNQFNYILTHRNDIEHPRIIKSIFPAYWFVGIDPLFNTVVSDKSYDFLKAHDFSKSKESLISVISSNKVVTKGHIKRLSFIEVLKREFGDELAVFGRGINDFQDKWDVMAPYKYHIVLENSSFDDEITEKIYDSFLAQCFSFYHGAKNIKKYFNKNSFCEIDIDDPKTAVEIIKSKISTDSFNQSENFIVDSKNKVLDKYNLFNLLYEQILAHQHKSIKVTQTFYPEPFFIEKIEKKTLYKRLKRKAKRILKK